MSQSEKDKRVCAYYSGRVQGVGFRFTAERIALDLGLRGWVRNLPDGKVELVSEGKEKDLHKLLVKIDDAFARYIQKKEVSWAPSRSEFSDFQIKFF